MPGTVHLRLAGGHHERVLPGMLILHVELAGRQPHEEQNRAVLQTGAGGERPLLGKDAPLSAGAGAGGGGGGLVDEPLQVSGEARLPTVDEPLEVQHCGGLQRAWHRY